MRVLLIGHVWPEPRSSAAGRRTLSVLELFAELGAELHVACAAGPSERAELPPALQIHSTDITLNCSSFDAYVGALQPDVVIFDRYMTEEQFSWRVEKACPDALRVLDSQDLHCLRHARQRALKAGRPIGVSNDEDWRNEVTLREIAAIWRSDVTLIISPAEMAVLKQRFAIPDSQLLYLPLLSNEHVSNEHVSAEQAGPSPDVAARRHCVVVGNFRHPPNWDGLQWLARDIWPRVRELAPDIDCHIYGAYPPPKAQALHSEKQGILVRGWAHDARQVTATARLALAPLRFGAGQKGKLLEAMEVGTPSVTTTVGAEGMAAPSAWPGAVADDPADFAEAIVALYRDPLRWQNAAQSSAAILQQHFLKSRYQPDFNDRILGLCGALERHRQANFTGQMLRHHSLRSHQYLSQWIEAKTRLQQWQSDSAAGEVPPSSKSGTRR